MIANTPTSIRQLLIPLVLASIAGCGGGSGKSAAKERLTLSKYEVNLTAPVTSGAHLEESITVTLENAASKGYYLQMSYTKHGLSNVFTTFDHGPLEMILQFSQPLDLRPGVYDDVVRIETCTDGTCSKLVPNLTATVTVELTINASDYHATLSTDSVALQAFVTDPFVPGVSDLDLTIDGLEVQPYVEVASTRNAVVSATGGMREPTHGSVSYDLRSPGEMGPGVYDDTITVMACLDRNCVNPIPPYPLILPVRVTVSDTVGGPNGYTVRIVDVAGTAMAWDRMRQVIYLAWPDPTSAGQDHHIVVFDPAAAQVATTVPISWRPGPMAISDDDQFLFVGTTSTEDQLKRLRLVDLTEDASIDLGKNSKGLPYDARELAVAPSQPKVVAMGRTLNPGGSNTAGLVVFDDTAPRSVIVGAEPDLANGPVIDHITWGADATHIYASNDSGQYPEVYDVLMDASGGRIVRTTPAATHGGLHFADGLLYTDNGLIFDAATLAQVATLVPQQDGTAGVPIQVFVDAAANRIYMIAMFLDAPMIGFYWPISLVSFDLTQHTQIASIPLDPTQRYSSGILRWGSDGLALLSPLHRLILVNGAFVAP